MKKIQLEPIKSPYILSCLQASPVSRPGCEKGASSEKWIMQQEVWIQPASKVENDLVTLAEANLAGINRTLYLGGIVKTQEFKWSSHH